MTTKTMSEQQIVAEAQKLIQDALNKMDASNMEDMSSIIIEAGLAISRCSIGKLGWAASDLSKARNQWERSL